MSELKIIPTYTTVLAITPTVDIITYYLNNGGGAIWSVFINDLYQYIDGMFIQEGYAVVYADPSIVPAILDIFIDNDGHLFTNGLDESKYSINANGHLIFTP